MSMQQQITDFIGAGHKTRHWNPGIGADMAQNLVDALGTFIFLAGELTILFLIVSFIIGVILEYMPAEKIQKILGSRGGKGYVSAGLLGALTPFCSCSTIPMLTGLLKARAGFGPTITVPVYLATDEPDYYGSVAGNLWYEGDGHILRYCADCFCRRWLHSGETGL